jgi:hypothetical protein
VVVPSGRRRLPALPLSPEVNWSAWLSAAGNAAIGTLIHVTKHTHARTSTHARTAIHANQVRRAAPAKASNWRRPCGGRNAAGALAAPPPPCCLRTPLVSAPRGNGTTEAVRRTRALETPEIKSGRHRRQACRDSPSAPHPRSAPAHLAAGLAHSRGGGSKSSKECDARVTPSSGH